MSFILSELLVCDVPKVYNLAIPFAYDGFERLKKIIINAQHHLYKKLPGEIEQACEDIFSIQEWFYKMMADQLKQSVERQMKQMAFSAYINLEQYIDDHIEALKLSNLGSIDILQSILHDFPEVKEFRKIKGVISDFSNTEFLYVLSLFKSSCALISLREFGQVLLQGIPNHQVNMLPTPLAHAINCTLEAQIAIEYAHQWEFKYQTDSSYSMRDWLTLARKDLANKALSSKYGNKFQLRKQKAIELYKTGSFHSRREAALRLVQPIQKFSEENQLRPLKEGSEFEAIYKWLSDYDKEKTTNPL